MYLYLICICIPTLSMKAQCILMQRVQSYGDEAFCAPPHKKKLKLNPYRACY